MTVTEYTGARIVSNQHVVSVAQHKTVHCYGSVKICVSVTHFAQLFVSGNVFLTWNGSLCPVSHVEQSLNWK